jgi:integrase
MQGSFARKRGSTWTAYFYVPKSDGTRQQRSKGGFRTKAEAQAFLTNSLNAVQKGDYVEPIKVTMTDYLTKQWLPIMEHSIRPTTWDSYQRMLKLHVMPRIGGVPLQNLTHQHLDSLYSELLTTGRSDGKGGLSPKTVRYIHNTIHKALKDAQRKQLVVRNVAEAADAPRLRQSEATAMKTWSGKQVRTFLAGLADHRLLAAYTLAATTGMRRGEVLGLRWSDIDFKTHRLAVRQTVIAINYKVSFGDPKTARGRRSIALDPTTVAELKAHHIRQRVERKALGAGYHDLDLVFPKVDGTPTHPDYFSQCFDRTVAKLKLPKIRLHDLRHTHATLGLAAGVPAKVMSERLGHATVAFTLDIYVHAVPQLDADAADQVAGLIFGDDESEEPEQTA